MILCPSCSEANEDDHQFCGKCGKSLAGHYKPSDRSKSKIYGPETDSYDNLDNFQRRHPSEQSTSHSDMDMMRASYGLGHRRSNISRTRNDQIHPGLYVAAACIPFVGFIIYFVIRDEKPVSGRLVLRAGVINFFVALILGIF